ncbi:NUDIX hydrolase [Thalassobacillus hwangdonensis]|uniref:NUDIX domain-containing protein n=1 Tax=Thalassobacillus hwangdonensis TaxID=546108 RepID=A0ABW3L1U8_9BACI
MRIIEKAYGYIIRIHNQKKQVLVFEHLNPYAGFQIPKGTVEEGETPLQAVLREMEEETGLQGLKVENKIAQDVWKNDDGEMHHRHFYKLTSSEDVEDEWMIKPTGGGGEEGVVFKFFWIESSEDVKLARGHGDYLDDVLSY